MHCGHDPNPLACDSVSNALPYRVATITDEFTHNSFCREFQAIPIEPGNWQQLFEKHAPQILFCESAWAGLDLNRKPWSGALFTPPESPNKYRVLRNIVGHCRKAGIPTIFWNKEDPLFYGSQEQDFARTASLFDYVFTTAEECVDRYRSDYGVDAAVLPFAANHHLFNPVETATRSSRIVFAGSWYPSFTQRSEEMENIIDHFINTGFELDIYTRYHGPNDPLNRWPLKYGPYLRQGVPHSRMPGIYKSSRFGLNVNTVVSSRSMFARRVFELMACNTLVISNYSEGVNHYFGDLVVFADRQPGRLGELADSEVDELRQKALHLVLKEHTYANRWRQILNTIGLPAPSENRATSWICPVKNTDELVAATALFSERAGANDLSGMLLIFQPLLSLDDVQRIVKRINAGIVSALPAGSSMQDVLHAVDQHKSTQILMSSPGALPSKNWLSHARYHLDYMEKHALTPAQGKKYFLVDQKPGIPLLVHRKQLAEVISSLGRPSQRAYTV